MNRATETWSRLGDRFSGEHAQFSWNDGVALIGLIAILAGFFALLKLLHHLHSDGWFARGQNGLFFELCRAHRLDRKSRRLLLFVAKQQQIEQPALLFLVPTRLVDVNGQLTSEEQLRLEWLRERLFVGSSAPLGNQDPGQSSSLTLAVSKIEPAASAVGSTAGSASKPAS